MKKITISSGHGRNLVMFIDEKNTTALDILLVLNQSERVHQMIVSDSESGWTIDEYDVQELLDTNVLEWHGDNGCFRMELTDIELLQLESE